MTTINTTTSLNISSSSNGGGVSVGFGTAALGENCYHVVTMALEAGFRRFDTAEAEGWYDQQATGNALQDYFMKQYNKNEEECLFVPVNRNEQTTNKVIHDVDYQLEQQLQQQCKIACHDEDLLISTKIPPWSLTSIEDIRTHATNSRQELVGFCQDSNIVGHGSYLPYPLDIYYIHAPSCWHGWHPQCEIPPNNLLHLREAWQGMEAVVGIDHSSRRIGLSNVHPIELKDIIDFVQERQKQDLFSATQGNNNNKAELLVAPPRMPDVVQAFADPIEPADELRRICQVHGIEFVSYSTLGTQHRHVSYNPVLTASIIQQLAHIHSRSTAEIVLSWALQKNMSVIPRSTQRHHIIQLARLLLAENPTFLNVNEMKQIDQMKGTV